MQRRERILPVSGKQRFCHAIQGTEQVLEATKRETIVSSSLFVLSNFFIVAMIAAFALASAHTTLTTRLRTLQWLASQVRRFLRTLVVLRCPLHASVEIVLLIAYTSSSLPHLPHITSLLIVVLMLNYAPTMPQSC